MYQIRFSEDWELGRGREVVRRIICPMSGPESLSWANIDQEWALVIINVPVGVAYNVTVICYDHP
jgi:hypothetical protein